MPEGTAAAQQKTSLIVKMAGDYGLEPTKFKNTIVKTLFPSDKQNASDEIVAAFLVVADKYQLNPFIKEIYAFPAKGGGIVPIVSIDGWNTLLNRQVTYDGIEFKDEHDEAGNVVAITAKIFRSDRSHPTIITEYMKECRRSTGPWDSHPIRMLRHKALIQCARIAFGFAGIYDEDEGRRVAEAGGGFEGGPAAVPIALISEEQRAELVRLAQEQGVVEKLGAIVNAAGFEMLAHITVDRFEDVVAAIHEAAIPDAEIIEETPAADHVDPSIHERPADEEVTEPSASEEDPKETLRANVQALFEELPKSVQKNLLSGRSFIKDMSVDELNQLAIDCRKAQ